MLANIYWSITLSVWLFSASPIVDDLWWMLKYENMNVKIWKYKELHTLCNSNMSVHMVLLHSSFTQTFQSFFFQAPTCQTSYLPLFMSLYVYPFQNYILLIMLLQLSWYFPLCPHPSSTPHSLRQSPHHCSCSWVIHISSLAIPFPILYFISPWQFYKYLFVLLNPLIYSPIPSHPLPSGNHQNATCIHDSDSILLCLVCFLDSIVNRYVFIAILLFIVLILFFLNKCL